MQVYEEQWGQYRMFLHEHPIAARSWQLVEVQKLAQFDGVEVAVGDQRYFGQMVDGLYARKRT
eukprot:2552217-Prorocentrum_lima.AAC.1